MQSEEYKSALTAGIAEATKGLKANRDSIFGQMNVIISTFGGILLLHETKTKREMIYTVVGIILIVIGSILTVIAN